MRTMSFLMLLSLACSNADSATTSAPSPATATTPATETTAANNPTPVADPPPAEDPASAPVHAAINTTGGLTGRGAGSITIDGTTAIATDQQHRTCTTQLTSFENDGLQMAARDAHPEQWKAEYTNPEAPQGHPDQIHYTINLGNRGASWVDDAEPPVPADLARLREVLWGIRSRVIKCADAKQQ